MSISPSNTKTTALLLLLMAWLPSALVWGQGRSIPRGSEASASDTLSLEERPLAEGQTYRYPLLNRLEIAIDLSDPVMKLFKNDYASYTARVTLDLHHRFLPQVVLGIGHCNELSEDDFYRYKVSPSFFAKAGMGYVFKYNSTNPNDFFWVFGRYGFSTYKADILDLLYNDGYWGIHGPINLTGLSYTCHWLEFGGAIKVQVWHQWSLGWEIWYKRLLSNGNQTNGDPYFVPGYGTTDAHIGFSFNVSYDINLR